MILLLNSVLVERIEAADQSTSYLVKATDTQKPGIIHVRRFWSDSEALSFAAAAAFGKEW